MAPFTTANYNVPQTVTITGVQDKVTDGAKAFLVLFTATSTAPAACVIVLWRWTSQESLRTNGPAFSRWVVVAQVFLVMVPRREEFPFLFSQLQSKR